LPLEALAPGARMVLIPNAMSILWAWATFDKVEIVAQANDKARAILKVRFKRKPPIDFCVTLCG
jgi:hypothetical protein